MVKLKMKSVDFFDTWLGMMNNPWLVTGSDLIMRHQIPVFVAHR